MITKKNKNLGGYIDYDYLDKLSDEERQFLDRFTAGYYFNNHRDNEVFQDQSTQELDALNNERRRDIMNGSGQVAHHYFEALSTANCIEDETLQLLKTNKKSEVVSLIEQHYSDLLHSAIAATNSKEALDKSLRGIMSAFYQDMRELERIYRKLCRGGARSERGDK